MKIIMATYFRNIKLSIKLILIVIIILSAKFTKSDTKLNYNISNGNHFIPLHYNVKIKFDAYKNIFYGNSNVFIQINRPTKNITIRQAEIFGIVKIDLIKLSDLANNQTKIEKLPLTINIQKLSFSNDVNIYLNFTSSLADFLYPGQYMLKIIYVPTILDDEDPFESYYTEKEKVLDNKSIKILKGKALFPYWNEPLFKSTFYISVYHHKDYTFSSNIGVKNVFENGNNMLQTSFNESSLISARHLTIVIINNTSFINIISSNANIEFWCRKEITNYMPLVESITKEILYFLNQKSTKKVPKINYITTRDFQHSNVKLKGFILLREEDIIYNKTLDHIAHKIKVANLIAQQTISHWYDDMLLWSKEGFIAFLAAHILDETKLIYRMMDIFIVQTQQESSRFDTFPDILSLHTANISTVHSFRSFYDYIKSSIIWRMVYHLISEDVFWNSINTYINRQYNQSNTLQTNELWNIMQTIWHESVGLKQRLNEVNIKDIINTWITQNRYPELHVNYLNNRTEFFLNIDLTFNKNAKYSTLVTYTSKSTHNEHISFHFWLKPNFNSSFDNLFDKYDWILVNLQQAEYYRVKYNIENWENLAHYLYYENHTDIHVLNRAQIIEDVFYYYMKKDYTISYKMFWNITRFLFNDTDYIAWYPMIKAVEYITCIWPVQYTHILKRQIYEMFYRLLQNIGFYDNMFESDFTKYLRDEAIKWACVLAEHECRLMAVIELQKDLQNSIQSKNRKGKEWIYCKGLMAADNTIWYKVYEKWQNTKDNTLLEYLTCSTDTGINGVYLKKVIEYKFIEEVSNRNTYINIVLLIIAKHAKTTSIFEFILKELEFIILSSNEQVDRITILIVIITHNISVDHFSKIKKWAKDHLSDEQLIDAIQQKIKKRKKEYQRQVNNYGF